MNAIPTSDLDLMYVTPYGSRLYGTADENSDHDYKAVYLPAIDNMLLGKRLVSSKARFDERGRKIGDEQAPMPADGLEIEYIPFQTFVRDFVRGQTYAVEMAHAIVIAGPAAPTAHDRWEHSLVVEMVREFSNSNLYSMIGFAQKQTFDYVHRAERLNNLQAVYEVVSRIFQLEPSLRLDEYLNGELVLDIISRDTKLETSTSVVNGNRTLRTLELNGRSYLETTSVSHLVSQLEKAIDKYGHRVVNASTEEIDWKSLSHAVRVYWQVLDICETRTLKFPFHEAAATYLLEVKRGRVPFETLQKLLIDLDVKVKAALETTSLQPLTDELLEKSEQWLLKVLRELYGLLPGA